MASQALGVSVRGSDDWGVLASPPAGAQYEGARRFRQKARQPHLNVLVTLGIQCMVVLESYVWTASFSLCSSRLGFDCFITLEPCRRSCSRPPICT